MRNILTSSRVKTLQPFIFPALILLVASTMALTQFGLPTVHASGPYTVTADSVNMWDVWDDPSAWTGPAGGNCAYIQCSGPGDVGNTCFSNVFIGSYICWMGDTSNCGNLIHTDYSCKGPSCTPDSSCAASTCNTTSCSDGCGGWVPGTKVCSACVPTIGQSCTSANSCGMTNPGTVQCDGSCSAVAPSDSLCPGPPTCTPDSSCAALTCTGFTCSDSCGNPYAGTQVCSPPPTTCTPDTSCAASTCNTSTCMATASDCSTYSIPGTNPSACTAPMGPTVTLSGSPTTVPAGGSSTLTWTSTGATSCTGFGFTAGPTSGSRSTGPLSSSATYGLSCTNSSTGATTNATPVTITVTGGICNDSGPVSLKASATRVLLGTTVKLTWSGVNVSGNCTIKGPGVNQTTAPSSCLISGSVNTPPITTQSTYNLTCPGSQTSQVIVNVQGKETEI